MSSHMCSSSLRETAAQALADAQGHQGLCLPPVPPRFCASRETALAQGQAVVTAVALGLQRAERTQEAPAETGLRPHPGRALAEPQRPARPCLLSLRGAGDARPGDCPAQERC